MRATKHFRMRSTYRQSMDLSRPQFGQGLLARECASELNQLATSATFAMSLGAKELFHTNFLAFLLESSNERLGPLQRTLRNALNFHWQEGELSRCLVWREKRNLDLVLASVKRSYSNEARDEPHADVDWGGRFHIIEAKLKSLPSARQLQGYTEALNTARLRLDCEDEMLPPRHLSGSNPYLTLALISTVPPAFQVDRWAQISWTQVADALQKAAASLPTLKSTKQGNETNGRKEDVLKAVLSDYAQSLQSLVTLVTRGRQIVEAALDNKGATYHHLLSECNARVFEALRIRDLVSKLMFNALRDRIVQKVGGEPRSDVLYTRATPGFELEGLTSRGGQHRLLVQVQGSEFRHCLASENSDPTLWDKATLLKDWFDTTVFGTKLTGKSTGERPEFKVYDSQKFLYRAAKVNETLSLQMLIEQVVKSVKLGRERSQDLEAILQDCPR